MNSLINRIIDYFATKVVTIVVEKVESGVFDQLVKDKVDAVVNDMLTSQE